jgi:hypothetical protein
MILGDINEFMEEEMKGSIRKGDQIQEYFLNLPSDYDQTSHTALDCVNMQFTVQM